MIKRGDNMGFWDSFRKGYEEESEKIADRQEISNYVTYKQELEEREQNYFGVLNSLDDGTLLRSKKSKFIPDKDKENINRLLENRGYIKNGNGMYDREQF